ncbi:3-deoxy-manno-octulosonate cytidylyltransferase [Luteibaculum oceani]|uniref:3-deoxy-manno-octulosonate cytidylyltransferase n=1 Tax=Luteibaculum oceani TaxID=1294296 RepID=A0A5C6V554_9FLAO|nr:3-deoxy-manno-octulosonate cytidylyltransferase [Luteibaculum oceani]TXC78948.1 3-deoxy-manno-octulosonate cytidylyltransferase [Luteibaculum oceani]
MKTLTVIPARYASTRFPGKPLVLIDGVSMIERVYRQVQKSKKSNAIIVATDDERILNHVKDFGGEAMLTNANHPSGTDRCFEVYDYLNADFDLLVNVQGDEPKLAPEAIDSLIDFMEQNPMPIGTLARKANEPSEYQNSNTVKVVFNKQQQALYFSRSPIPFYRDKASSEFYQHIGIYAFKKEVIEELRKLQPSKLEQNESLEQLRWLDNSFNIGVELTTYRSQGIDTPEDINKL